LKKSPIERTGELETARIESRSATAAKREAGKESGAPFGAPLSVFSN
jgi:hypothetical protein